MPLAKNPAPTVTHGLAERHEALFLRLTALHNDLSTLAAKKQARTVRRLVMACCPRRRRTPFLAWGAPRC